jgi:hypothetical protein
LHLPKSIDFTVISWPVNSSLFVATLSEKLNGACLVAIAERTKNKQILKANLFSLIIYLV